MDIGTWLRRLGLERYEQAFRDNDIDVGLLPSLGVEDLREIGIVSLGHRKQLLAAIAALISTGASTPAASPQVPQAGGSHAERRQLTVMFVDLVGSTALSARLDPEDMREVLHAYQGTVTSIITRAEGYVAKLMGDGVLAYFSWPQAYEDEEERAVRAGLEIVNAVRRLSLPTEQHLAARVGIATGLVVVGDIVGEGAAREQAVIGETPNLAARLQEAAPPDGVIIANSTRRLIGRMFELRELGSIHLKGFAEPVVGYQVLGAAASGSRFEALRSGDALPMVGRDQELALIVERWRRVLSREGQAVLLVGEAGIGKSRLVQAAVDAIADGNQSILRYQCSPHHAGTAFWPVIQQLLCAAGISPTDSEDEKLKKITFAGSAGESDPDIAVPLIADMLGIQRAQSAQTQGLTAVQRRTRTFGVLVEHLLGTAKQQPVLILFEDVHWIDPTSLELIGEIVDRIFDTRTLILLTSRPDNQPSLGGHPHVMRLTLNRLGRKPTQAIVERLTHGKAIAPELVREIAARTDGVPLFIEELTKAVIETGASKPAETVPVSLHASLMARLDRVHGVKEVAQLAACIGREFSYALLAAVAPFSEVELQTALERLVLAELVFRRGIPPEATYTFKHALVRDAAHESLLKAQRQQFHARIALELEAHYLEVVEAEPELVAEHHIEAGSAEPAVNYLYRAGQRALSRSATAEAVVQLTKGLAILEAVPHGPERQRHELAFQLALGQASIATKGFAAEETGRAYARARELCEELGKAPELYPVLYGRSVFHFQRGELGAAHDVARELLRRGEVGNDIPAQITGHRMIGSALSQLGRLAESREHFLAALTLYDPIRDRSSAIVYAIDSRVMCTSWLSHVLLLLGYPDQALARDSEAMLLARDRAHANTYAVALVWGCIFRQLLRDAPNAKLQAETVMEISSEHGFPLYHAAGRVVHGWALADAGQIDEGLAEIHGGLTDYIGTGAQMWSPYFLGLLAEAEMKVGRSQNAAELVQDALDRVGRTATRWIEPELYRLRAQVSRASRGLCSADPEADYRQSMLIASELGAPLWELRGAAGLARLWVQNGKHESAVTLLRSICDKFTEGLDIRDLVEARALVDDCSGKPMRSVQTQEAPKVS